MKPRIPLSIITLTGILVVYAFLFYYFDLGLLLSKTITSGGDMGSDYYPALYLRDNLLPNGKIIGRSPGWYAGFPLFQFYFPLSFLAMAVLSYAIPLQIAFKLVTVLGIFLLPVAAFYCFRCMKIKYPVIAALIVLPFLFMQANSMWGGNIPSTLAGESSYSIGIAFVLIYFGYLWKHIDNINNKSWAILSVLFSVVVLLHIYTTIFAFFTSLIFLLSKKNFRLRSVSLFKVYFLVFLLTAWWSIPMFYHLEYTTSYADTWSVALSDIFPLIISAFFISIVFLLRQKPDDRIKFWLFAILVSVLFFFIAEHMGVVNIRFVPFLQLSLLMLSALGLHCLPLNKKHYKIFLLVFIFAVIVWTAYNTTYIPSWIRWNYSGFESKKSWDIFYSLNEFVKGDQSMPRVMFEHSDKHNEAGTVRAFESLPLFSGRSNTEGLFMQSSSISPFVFYLQSETSEQNSCPFWKQYPCTQYNLTSGTVHMKMFNVQYIIAVSNKAKNAMMNNSEYRKVYEKGEYVIFELKTNPNRYVTVPRYEPIYVGPKNWKRVSYEWFKTLNPVHLVFKPYDPIPLKTQRIEKTCNVTEQIGNDVIKFQTDCIGEPHIISISYHPNWRVEGADKVYLVSPAFMLVYPQQSDVVMRFEPGIVDKFASILSVIGILATGYLFLHKYVGKIFKRFLVSPNFNPI